MTGQPKSERAIILYRGAQGLRGIHMPLGWVERRGFYFPGMESAPGAPALTEGQPHARSDLFPSYFFLGGWISEETMKLWDTMRNYKKLWGSGPHWQFFFWSPLCNRTGTKKSCLLVWMVNENQFPISILHLAAAQVMTSPTTTPSLSPSLFIGHVQF